MVGTSAGAATVANKQSKDTLRIVAAIEPVNMNPVKQANSFGNFWEPINEPLIKQDKNFRLTKNGIITNWQQKTPGVWTFTIRPNLKFTNGEPLDAAAVGFTMETYRDTVGAPMRAYLTKLVSTKAVNKTTLEATFQAGDLSIPAVLSSVRALPRVYYSQVGHDAFGLAPIGSGPYKFGSWQKGVSLKLVANDKYWGTKAKIKNLDFSFATDADTRANLLASGAVDFAWPISVQRQAGLKTKKTTVVQKADRVQLALFMMAHKPQLADVRLREAVVNAINVEAITKSVLLNKGWQAQLFAAPAVAQQPAGAGLPEAEPDQGSFAHGAVHEPDGDDQLRSRPRGQRRVGGAGHRSPAAFGRLHGQPELDGLPAHDGGPRDAEARRLGVLRHQPRVPAPERVRAGLLDDHVDHEELPVARP